MKRFWNKVDRNNDCWEWTAYKNRCGYGCFRYKNKTELAHRISWLLNGGVIPNGLCILHHCDNPGCVNPAHLFVGTQAENNRDRARKGRSRNGAPLGTRNGSSKLTPKDIPIIRKKLQQGNSQHQLAREYGLSQSSIRDIQIGKTWSHVK